MFDRLFGLPAHPLLVHVPIVLLPVVGVGAVAMLSSRVRDRYGWLVVVLSGIGLVGAHLATESGERLEDHVDKSAALSRHTELADMIRPLALVFFVAVLAVMLVHRQVKKRPSALWSRLGIAVGVLSVVVALVLNVQLVRVGHNGARATWQDATTASAEGRSGG